MHHGSGNARAHAYGRLFGHFFMCSRLRRAMSKCARTFARPAFLALFLVFLLHRFFDEIARAHAHVWSFRHLPPVAKGTGRAVIERARMRTCRLFGTSSCLLFVAVCTDCVVIERARMRTRRLFGTSSCLLFATWLFWATPGLSWDLLGLSWAPLGSPGPLLGPLGLSWALLGLSWASPGPLLSSPGLPKGSWPWQPGP